MPLALTLLIGLVVEILLYSRGYELLLFWPFAVVVLDMMDGSRFFSSQRFHYLVELHEWIKDAVISIPDSDFEMLGQTISIGNGYNLFIMDNNSFALFFNKYVVFSSDGMFGVSSKYYMRKINKRIGLLKSVTRKSPREIIRSR